MRILQICADPGIPPDGTKGASIHFRSLHRAFLAAGNDVAALVGKPPRSWQGDSGRVADRGEPWPPGAAPDFIYERYSLGHTFGLARARALGSPFILEVNAPLVDEALEHRPSTVQAGDREIERVLFREADAVVAVSEPLRAFVARIRGTSEGTAVVRNGCDPRLAPDAAGEGDRRHVIAFLGHPKPWHGAGNLVPLLAETRRRGFDARLLVIGGGPGADEVRSAARSAGLADFVEITGPLSHERALERLSGATVSIAPYPEIPFFYFCPLKAIECLGAGVPLVTTAQGDLPDIVGDAAVLVPPGDAPAMAEAVAGLLGDPARRAAIQKRARERAGLFTWEAAARRICEIASGLRSRRRAEAAGVLPP